MRLWGHREDHIREIAEARENRRYLPGIPLPGELWPTADLHDAVSDAELVLIAVPSRGFSPLLRQLEGTGVAPPALLWATKGLDAETGAPLHVRVAETFPGCPLAVLSGPSFAAEVARGLPTAVTVASSDERFAEEVATCFHGAAFRVYTSRDVVGVELGGAVKNVLAIAVGIADGLAFGANARAGLVTRGLAELRRLGRAMGATDQTFMGLAGVGDLILTCTDDQSRNRRMGLALGRGQGIADAEAAIGQTVEGVRTAAEVARLSRARGVEMPICEQVYRLVAGEVDARGAARELMRRDPRPEPE